MLARIRAVKKHKYQIEIQQGLNDSWYFVLSRSRDRQMLLMSVPHFTYEECFQAVQKLKRKKNLNRKLSVLAFIKYKMVIEQRHDTV